MKTDGVPITNTTAEPAPGAAGALAALQGGGSTDSVSFLCVPQLATYIFFLFNY